jgi:hypothetical protein
MSSCKRVWDRPLVINLSVRKTAATVGPGADTFLKMDVYGRPGLTPTAPLVDVGARPMPVQAMTSVEPDRREWQTPLMSTLSV